MSAPDPSNLDFPQVLRGSFDEAQGRLRVDAVASVGDISVDVDLDPATDGVHVADQATGNKLTINPDGSINVVLDATGAATTPNIQNVTIPTANVENAIVLPLETKHFQIKVRGSGTNLQLAFVVGESNTRFITIPRGCNYSENDLSLTTLSRVLYIRSASPNIVLECITWV